MVIVIILMMIGIFIVPWIVTYFSSPLYGTWYCGDEHKLVMKENQTFELYQKDDKKKLHVIGTYDVKRSRGKDFDTYDMTLVTTNRTYDGILIEEPYQMEYEVTIRHNSKDAMMLKDSKQTGLIRCKKQTKRK